MFTSKLAVKLSGLLLIVALIVPQVSAAVDLYYMHWVKSLSYGATCDAYGFSFTLPIVQNVPAKGGTLIEKEYINNVLMGTYTAAVPGGQSTNVVTLSEEFTNPKMYPYSYRHVDELHVPAGRFTYLTSRSTIMITCSSPGNAVVYVASVDY